MSSSCRGDNEVIGKDLSSGVDNAHGKTLMSRLKQDMRLSGTEMKIARCIIPRTFRMTIIEAIFVHQQLGEKAPLSHHKVVFLIAYLVHHSFSRRGT